MYWFDTPQRITAGYAGEEPVFFDCCDCGEEDAVMHGCMGTQFSREGVAILSNWDGTECASRLLLRTLFSETTHTGKLT